MAMNTAERQREFKERMYAKGLMQKIIWVPREAGLKITLYRQEFIRRLDLLTMDLSVAKANKLYKALLKNAEEMTGGEKKKKKE